MAEKLKGKLTSVHQTIPRAGSAGYDCAKGGLMMNTGQGA